MAEVVALPPQAMVFLDARGDERVLRVSWHEEAGVVVLSIWRLDRCVSSFRVPVADVPDLVTSLVTGLAQSHPAVRPQPVEAAG